MTIVNNTNKNGQYFTSCYYEWDYMLFELFNHPIDEELASTTQQ